MAPLVIVAAATAIGAARILVKHGVDTTREVLLKGTAPAILRIFFLAYPIVTNVAFEAFSCFEFENGDSFLKADVSVKCDTSEHYHAMNVALIVICVYPIGLFVLNGVLLAMSRKAIVLQKPTALSRATAFLHREYKPVAFLWELVEMSRRFLLVGVYVVGPFHPGSMMQLALASLTCVMYLVVQMLVVPYRAHADNYLALGCSLSLVVLFLTSIFYKFAMLTEVRGIHDRMSQEQREDFELLAAPLTFVMALSVIGALILCGVIVIAQAGQHARDSSMRARAAMARRLHYLEGGKEATLRVLPALAAALHELHPRRTLTIPSSTDPLPHAGPRRSTSFSRTTGSTGRARCASSRSGCGTCYRTFLRSSTSTTTARARTFHTSTSPTRLCATYRRCGSLIRRACVRSCVRWCVRSR